jgi:hydrogenase maturation protease
VTGSGNQQSASIWIVGFGNRHRRDDGIGPYAADRLKARFDAVAGVQVIALHQLGPELAEEIRTAAKVIFIDAAIGAQSKECSWRKLRPEMELRRLAHSMTAEALLGLTHLLYKQCPPAWMVSVQGSDFEFGEGLSAAGEANAKRAMEEIERIIGFHLQKNAEHEASFGKDEMEKKLKLDGFVKTPKTKARESRVTRRTAEYAAVTAR